LLAHKAYVASMWCNIIYIDHCTMEGLSSAGNIQGSPTDTLVTIFRSKSINEVLKWVDNFVFFHIPIHRQLFPPLICPTDMVMTYKPYSPSPSLSVFLGTPLTLKAKTLAHLSHM